MPVSKVFRVGEISCEVYATARHTVMLVIQADPANPIESACIELDQDDADAFSKELRSAIRLSRIDNG